MGSEQEKEHLTVEELTLRLGYFSRQCWHQRHLYSHQNAALRQRIADQDAQLKEAHDRLRDAHSRLQEATAYLGHTFAQLQDVMTARIAAELKLAGYGLLEPGPSTDPDPVVSVSSPLEWSLLSYTIKGSGRNFRSTRASAQVSPPTRFRTSSLEIYCRRAF